MKILNFETKNSLRYMIMDYMHQLNFPSKSRLNFMPNFIIGKSINNLLNTRYNASHKLTPMMLMLKENSCHSKVSEAIEFMIK